MSAALQLEPGMTDAEWQTRCELASLYQSSTTSAGPT